MLLRMSTKQRFSNVSSIKFLRKNDLETGKNRTYNISKPERCTEEYSIIIKDRLENFQNLLTKVREILGHNKYSCTFGKEHRVYVKAVADVADLLQSNINHRD